MRGRSYCVIRLRVSVWRCEKSIVYGYSLSLVIVCIDPIMMHKSGCQFPRNAAYICECAVRDPYPERDGRVHYARMRDQVTIVLLIVSILFIYSLLYCVMVSII